MANPQVSSRGLKRIEDSELLQSIMTAVANYDLSSSPEWNDLDQLLLEQLAFLAKPFALSALVAKVKETMTAS